MLDATPDAAAIERALDALDPEARIAECRGLVKKHMARLWEAAAAAPKLGLEFFVPPSASDGARTRATTPYAAATPIAGAPRTRKVRIASHTSLTVWQSRYSTRVGSNV